MKIKFKKLFFITVLLIIGLAVLTWGISCLWGIYCFHSVKNQKNEQGVSRWTELEQNVLSRPAGTNLFDLSPWKEWLEAKTADPAAPGDGELSKYSTIRSDFIENALTNLNELITQYQISSDKQRSDTLSDNNRYKKAFMAEEQFIDSVLTKKAEFDQLMADSEEYKKLTSQQQAAKFCLFFYSEDEPLRDKIKKNLKLAQYEAIPVFKNCVSLPHEWLYIQDNLILEAADYARIYAILDEREKVLEEFAFLLDLVTLDQCANANSIELGYDYISNYRQAFFSIQETLPYHALLEDDLLQLEKRLAKIAYMKDFQKNLEGEVYLNTGFGFEYFIQRFVTFIFYGKFKQGDAKYLQYFWNVYPLINVQTQMIDEEKWKHFSEPYVQLERKFRSLHFDQPKYLPSSIFTVFQIFMVIQNIDNIKTITESFRFDSLKDQYDWLKLIQNRIITSCALERYYLKNKCYPEKLEDLTPDYLETIPENILHPEKDSPYQSDGKSYSFGTFSF